MQLHVYHYFFQSVSATTLKSSEKAEIKISSAASHTSASVSSEATKLPMSTRGPVAISTNSSTPKETGGNSAKYCQLFEQEDECNGDQDCSWCNMLDLCVGRNKEDFKRCTGSKRNEEINTPSMYFYVCYFSKDAGKVGGGGLPTM